MSGMAVGALTIPAAAQIGVTGTTQQVAWVCAMAGFAMLPDLDQRGATIGRLWGPITAVVATGIGKVAKGHRNGTHDAVLAPLAFGGIALLAPLHPWASMALLAFAIGIAAKAMHLFVPGGSENTVLGNLALSWGGAYFLTQQGDATFGWLPFAVAGGVLVHIAGDALTVGGCPVPLTWMDGHAKRYSLKLFKTGRPIETHFLAWVFLAIGLYGVWLHVTMPDFEGAIRDAVEAIA
jgi:membrane-bound metal-dependent hydrolase YbcI (DUF457 family)